MESAKDVASIGDSTAYDVEQRQQYPNQTQGLNSAKAEQVFYLAYKIEDESITSAL